MRTVGLDPDGRASPRLAQALEALGLTVTEDRPGVRIGRAPDTDFTHAAVEVGRVLDGERLLLCGGTGPLLAALHLTPGEETCEGALEACRPELPALGDGAVRTVTGVGYALYRCGGRCVAVGGPRGRGHVAYVADGAPPDLVAACAAWLADQPGTAKAAP